MCLRLFLIAALANSPIWADDGEARITDSDQSIRTRQLDKSLLLNIADVADAFELDVKVVKPGQLITLCTKGENGFCYPLRISQIPSLETKSGWYVDANTVARILRLEISNKDGSVQLKDKPVDPRSEKPEFDRDVVGHAQKRGFRVGQTLPDIPLYDMNGEEVRFSRFLGKQYIIYCWASW